MEQHQMYAREINVFWNYFLSVYGKQKGSGGV